MAKCCGKDRASRFCPDCGKAVAAPLLDLLAHLRKNEKQRRHHCRLWQEAGEDVYPERVKSCTEAADRWKAWADAVEALLSAPEPPA